MNYKLRAQLAAIVGTCAVFIASLTKLNYIFGTIGAFFSATQMVNPLIGAFGGIGASIFAFAVRSLVFGLSHPLSAGIAFYHLPTLCGSLYLATENRLFRAGAPLVCLVLFVANPVGSQAAAYSLYWLIPAAVAVLNRKTFFLNALGATFTAHAVGSVIFLYTKSTTPLLWYSLLPVVAVERLVFAAGMTAVYCGINYLKNNLANLITAVQQKKITLHG